MHLNDSKVDVGAASNLKLLFFKHRVKTIFNKLHIWLHLATQVHTMPRSTLSHESIGSMSESVDLSQYSDEESVYAEVDVESANNLSLTDQTLLKQAFRGTVHSRKTTAKDWRHERESQFDEDLSSPPEIDPKKTDTSRSYSSKIRGFLRKLACTGKPCA